MEKPMVSIVVLSYNGVEYLEDSLSSLFGQTYKNIEIILVDNNSADNSVEYASKHFPTVRIIKNEKNLGLTGGNNAGIKAAKGKYVAFFNNDAVADPKWMEELVDVIEQDEKVGFVSGKIYDFSNKKKLQFAGSKAELSYRLHMELTGAGEIDNGAYDELSTIDFAHGCALLTRKDLMMNIGLQDEDFFIYFDEIDYTLRAKKLGFKSIYVPKAIVYHKHEPKSDVLTPFEHYYLSRNLVMLYFKHAETRFLIPFLFLRLIAMPTDMLKQYLTYRDIRLPVIYLKATLWWLTHLPMLMKKRRESLEAFSNEK